MTAEDDSGENVPNFRSSPDASDQPPYELTPQKPLGAIIRGLKLSNPLLPKSTIDRLKSDIYKHHLLIIKGQGALEAEEQIRVSEWFGEIDTLGIEQHEKSPDPRILRVSNDSAEGFCDFGVSGFHIDGSFMEMPNAFSIYHIIHAPKEGSTWFVLLNDVYQSLPEKQRKKWDRLWICKQFAYIRGSANQAGCVIHPLVYDHPITAKKVLCFHLGKTTCFIHDFGSRKERKTSGSETAQIVGEIYDAIIKDKGRLVHAHKWEPGDFIISDNLSLGHFAHPSTQLPREQVGLRVMHRTIVKGSTRPSKWVQHRRKRKPKCGCVIQ